MGNKIVFIASKDYNFYNFRSELILELVNKGYEVTLICPYGKKIEYFIERGCKFVGHEMDRRGTNAFNDIKLIRSYYRILKNVAPDLVLTYTTKSSVYSGLVCRWLRIPYIVNNAGLITNHNYGYITKTVLNILYKLGFGGAKCMMYQNTLERDVLNKILKNRIKYIDIPGSGVNLNQFSYQDYPVNAKVIVFNYVARVVKIKGIEEYLDCAERIHLEFPNTLFKIYGGYDDDSYRERIKQLEKQGIVEDCGVQMDMKPHIKNCHAAIHASYYEGMTNVVLEHGAIGRPTIGSDIPGVKEGIDDGISGYIFKVKNVESLVEKVRAFMNLSMEQKAEMGKAARLKMEKEFDRNIVTNIYLEEIQRILQ